jgi:GT2 family glycosyltransferase
MSTTASADPSKSGGERLPGVSMVVLNYDGRQLLEIVLPTLSGQSQSPLEVVVVDNGSRDDSRAYLAEQWPQVRVVVIPENIGVAAACSRGLEAARGTYVALLNNDIELEPSWIQEMLGGLERHPRAGSAACKLLNFYRREELDGAGDVFLRNGAATKRGHRELDRGQYDREEEVLAPTAGAALYRASALMEVGLFDASLGSYFEDVDWGIRAQSLGYRCIYVPSAVGYHMESRTTGGRRNPTYLALQWRNTVGLLVKHLPLWWLVLNAPHILRHHLAGLRDSFSHKMLGAHLRGYMQLRSAIPGWLRARRQISAARRLSSRELASALAAGRPA